MSEKIKCENYEICGNFTGVLSKTGLCQKCSVKEVVRNKSRNAKLTTVKTEFVKNGKVEWKCEFCNQEFVSKGKLNIHATKSNCSKYFYNKYRIQGLFPWNNYIGVGKCKNCGLKIVANHNLCKKCNNTKTINTYYQNLKEKPKREPPQFIENSNHLCDYGCGKTAKFQFKNGKWCCEKRWSKCSEFRKRISEKSEGREPWNKGKTNVFSKEYIKKMSEIKSGKRTQPCLEKTKKKISEANKFSLKDWQTKHPFFCKIEELREDPKTGNIQTRCKNHNCKNSKEKDGWFTPTYYQMMNRYAELEYENRSGGCYFYCSEYCKQTCILYNLNISSIGKTLNLKNKNIPGLNIWRQEVVKRNIEKHGKLTCEYCGNTNENEMCAHHKIPIKINSEEALDPDNGEICCGFGKGNNCHLLKGHAKGTKYSVKSLAERKC